MMEQEIEHKILSWKVKKVGEGDYRVIRPHWSVPQPSACRRTCHDFEP